MGFILRMLLALVAFQVIGGLVRSARQRQNKEKPRRTPDRGNAGKYDGLTPYEIEDAEFEELPKREE